ncbi:MAG: energy-coupling factor ABC transporter permease [Chloroflexota bacterium]|nr:energy-coupling factor ABC transporter permease [Chloroflexota bacterium]
MVSSINLPLLDGSISLPLPLHAPDGFFSLPVAIAGYLLAALFISIAIRQTNKNLNERIVPMMGVMAAFIFAAQMLNFPVAGGTSGHLVGGALAAILLGPWAAILVMTAVVGLQALLFQDGGLVVLGVNLVNMSIVSVLSGYGAYWLSRKVGAGFKTLMVGGFVAAWISVVASAVVTALFLGFSGTTPLAFALVAMIGVHMIIGIGEALITVFALSFIRAARPALLEAPAKTPAPDSPVPQAAQATGGMGARWWVVGYIIAVAVTLLAPFASGSPDGLERVAEDAGFIERAQDAPYAIIADYVVPGIQNEGVATILAGIIGVTIIYALVAGGVYGLYALYRRRTGRLAHE